MATVCVQQGIMTTPDLLDRRDSVDSLYTTRSGRRHLSRSSTSTRGEDGSSGDDDDGLETGATIIPESVVRERLNALCERAQASFPAMETNKVYEVTHWIDFPVQLVLSDIHGTPQFYLSTRSIGEFVLNLLNASMSVKTNITTTIVRKFKAYNPDVYRYGLLVKTVGQKPEKSYVVQLIPRQQEQPQGAGKGRGSHSNSRGTSYYWALSHVLSIVNPLINTIQKSKAFRDITYGGTGRAGGTGEAGAYTEEDEVEAVMGGRTTTSLRGGSAAARGKDLRRSAQSRHHASKTVHSPPLSPRPTNTSTSTTVTTMPHHHHTIPLSPVAQVPQITRLLPTTTAKMTSPVPSPIKPAYYQPQPSSPSTSSDDHYYHRPEPRYDPLLVMASHAAAQAQQDMTVPTDASSAADDSMDCRSSASPLEPPRSAISYTALPSSFATDLAPPPTTPHHIDDLRASIALKRKRIEAYNNALVGLVFEVAEEERLLQSLESVSLDP